MCIIKLNNRTFVLTPLSSTRAPVFVVGHYDATDRCRLRFCLIQMKLWVCCVVLLQIYPGAKPDFSKHGHSINSATLSLSLLNK